MPTCESRGLVLARAVVMATTVLGLAVGAHVVGGGPPPSAAATGVLGVLVLVASSLIARGRLRLWTLAPALGAIEAGLHGALGILPTAADLVLLPPVGHGHGAVTATLPALPMLADHAHGGTSWVMLLSHTAATLVTAGLLIGADRAARMTRHWLRTTLPLLLAPTAGSVVPLVRTRPRPVPTLLRASAGACRSHRRRGPPVLLAAA